jgi:hypothetical protein
MIKKISSIGFILALAGCATAPRVVPVPPIPDAAEIVISPDNQYMSVHYEVAVASTVQLASKEGDDLAAKLELEAVKRAKNVCTFYDMKTVLRTRGSVAQENNKIIGKAQVLCGAAAPAAEE